MSWFSPVWEGYLSRNNKDRRRGMNPADTVVVGKDYMWSTVERKLLANRPCY